MRVGGIVNRATDAQVSDVRNRTSRLLGRWLLFVVARKVRARRQTENGRRLALTQMTKIKKKPEKRGAHTQKGEENNYVKSDRATIPDHARAFPGSTRRPYILGIGVVLSRGYGGRLAWPAVSSLSPCVERGKPFFGGILRTYTQQNKEI